MNGKVLPIPSADVSTGTAIRSILAKLAGGLRAGLWSLPLILKGDIQKKEPTITLIRGVHDKHPDFANVYLGRA
ncbi:hypothetical protein EG344_22135 [Chryseobacterium sp. G0162]|uniref:hypothetical protein n=1 Tax=Chryseobacterium sp. G0162 TaxID=2487063 RepID=UPI000F4DBCD5|nr:hypothetical protein [Chryseobacterium sp. G0162]AZB11340.1 hypothetical protein EG344_22135 [Chryseobacterium sp. G0162]